MYALSSELAGDAAQSTSLECARYLQRVQSSVLNGAGFCLPSLQNDRSNLVRPLRLSPSDVVLAVLKSSKFNGISNCLGVLGNLTCFSYDYAWLPRSAEIPPPGSLWLLKLTV